MIDNKEIEYLKLVINYKSNNLNILDIGGFEGNWSDVILNLNIGAKIKIFEPDYNNFKFLENKYSNVVDVDVINKGVSNENNELTYYKLNSNDKGVRGMSGFVLRDVYKKYDFSEIKIDVIKIDSIVDYNIDFMKIDTEGFEYNVLMGCEKLLSEHKIDFIQFEYGGTYQDYNIKLNDVISYLKKYDYHVYDLDKNNEFIKIDKFEDDYLYNNFIATHKIIANRNVDKI